MEIFNIAKKNLVSSLSAATISKVVIVPDKGCEGASIRDSRRLTILYLFGDPSVGLTVEWCMYAMCAMNHFFYKLFPSITIENVIG